MYQLPFEELKKDVYTCKRVQVYTISQLNSEVRRVLESSFPFVWVEGEISNFRHHSSGHMYFTLKDASSEIEAVMFEEATAYLNFEPEDGTKVLAYGRVTLYERRGRYQLVIEEMRPAGIGKLQLQFEQLKEKLQQEGFFDAQYKVAIPAFPERVGIITSAEGAAIRDIISIIAKRYPPAELLLFPVKVQGAGAAEEIAQAIIAANRYSETLEKIDTLIVGRGGGSLEDLWAFNEEIVAQAIFASKIPVISAVGHEIDFTIADFVADLRAPTPSAAAQLVVPDRQELNARIDELFRKLVYSQAEQLRQYEEKLLDLARSYAFKLPLQAITEAEQTLDHLSAGVIRAIKLKFKAYAEQLESFSSRLETASPMAILKRGYSITTSQAGEIIKSFAQVEEQDRVKVKLYEGELICKVEERRQK